MSGTKRKGFAMIMAIFVIVIVATGGALLMRNAAIGSKSVSDNYIRAQGELLAQSATEFALMRAQGVNTAATCLNRLNITVNSAGNVQYGFDVNVSLAYSFRNGAPAGGCTTLAQNTGKDTMVLIDVRVDDRGIGNEDIRVHKRSWQKL